MLVQAQSVKVAVVQSRYDQRRTGVNDNETVLTPALLQNPDGFGKLFTLHVLGDVYSQPLVIPNVTMAYDNKLHDVVYISTMHNNLYAFDAYDGTLLWHDDQEGCSTAGSSCNLGISRTSMLDSPGHDIWNGEVGILSTGYIDQSTGTWYVVAANDDSAHTSGNASYSIYAIDITTGNLKPLTGNGNKIAGSVGVGPTPAPDAKNGQLAFTAQYELQRPGLALVKDTIGNSYILVLFGSEGDDNQKLYHGWVFVYKTTDFTTPLVWATSPTAVVQTPGLEQTNCNESLTATPNYAYQNDECNAEGGIWQSGNAPAVDVNNNFYLSTANGWYDITTDPQRPDYGSSVLKMQINQNSHASPQIVPVSAWTPTDWFSLIVNDDDLGVSGPVLIPSSDTPGGNPTFLAGSKLGALYSNVRQTGTPAPQNSFTEGTDSVDCCNPFPNLFSLINPANPQSYINKDSHMHSAPIYWSQAAPQSPLIFAWGEKDVMRSFIWNGSLPFGSIHDTNKVVNSDGMPAGILAVSGNQGTNGIVWATKASTTFQSGKLLALDATTLKLIWDSDIYPLRDSVGRLGKFDPPTVANGRVYLATSGDGVAVYGPNPPLSNPTIQNHCNFSPGSPCAVQDNITSSVTLTGDDWIRWADVSTQYSGTRGSPDRYYAIRKAAVYPQITSFTVVPPLPGNPNTPQPNNVQTPQPDNLNILSVFPKYGKDISTGVTYTWATGDGTHPVPSANGQSAAVINQPGGEFLFTVPADTNQRTLQVYVGADHARGVFYARMGDGSQDYGPYPVDGTTGLVNKIFTLNYTAKTFQTLTVTWQKVDAASSDTNNGITLQAAVVSGSACYPPIYVGGSAGAATPTSAGPNPVCSPPLNYIVTTSADDQNDSNCTVSYCTLRQAVNAANAVGGTQQRIGFAATVTSPIVLNSTLTINANMSIIGLGQQTTLISGNYQIQPFDVKANITKFYLVDLTVENGFAQNGNGGGLLNEGGQVNLLRVTFDHNATAPSNPIQPSGSPTPTPGPTSTPVPAGSFAWNGGAIYTDVGGTLNITSSTFTNNQAVGLPAFGNVGNGGAIFIHKGTTTITGSTFQNNSASNIAGALGNYVDPAANTNYAASTLTLHSSTFTGNTALGTQGNLVGFLAGAAGGIGNDGTLIIDGSTFNSNVGQTAQSAGGAIGNAGVATLSNSTLVGNSAQYGGGIANGAVTDATQSLWQINGQMILINLTLANNTAGTGDNLSDQESALFPTPPAIIVKNSILADANPSSSSNCATNWSTLKIDTSDHNLDNGTSCVTAAYLGSGSLQNANPLLSALADNGGLTWTMALQAGSPAIDAGDTSVCAVSPINNVDQRGTLRDALCDIGALEYIAPPPTATPTNTPMPSSTAALTNTLTSTPTMTRSSTVMATSLPSNTSVPTFVPPTVTLATATPTYTSIATNTPVPPSNTSAPTNTPLPSATSTPTATSTTLPSATPSVTNTALPTITPTNTSTAAPSLTNTPLSNATPSATNAPTVTPTATATSTPTATLQQNIEFSPSDGANGDLFGYAVALSSDASTIIVGAPLNNTSTGAAYVYSQTGSTWTLQQKLTASDGLWGNIFGRAVALSSDGNTALIGAPFNVNLGSVYVFTRTGSTWTQQQKLIASDGTKGDRFGRAVALSSDGNTALISDYTKNGGKGAAYTFTRSGSTWTQQQELTPSDSAFGDSFGIAVALSSDANTVLIGADGKNGGGAAYTFARSGNTWSQQQKLIASDASNASYFGYAVALSSDGSSAFIGDFGVNGVGAAYTFTRSGSTWTQQQELTASDGANNDEFGYAIALSGNGNTALIGAINKNGGTGATYFFTQSGNTWSQRQELTASDATGGSYFGSALALSNSSQPQVIGAYGKNAGVVYLYP
jgi:CSLREA domain-containing protein